MVMWVIAGALVILALVALFRPYPDRDAEAWRDVDARRRQMDELLGRKSK